jgi:hypothetical protein
MRGGFAERCGTPGRVAGMHLSVSRTEGKSVVRARGS